MTQDDSPAAPSESRRDRLDARRRRYRWAGFVCALLIVGGGATAAAFALTDQAASTVDGTGAENATSSRTFDAEELPELSDVESEEPVRPLSYEEPLRVWVGGDSLSGALGPALGNFNDATGVVETTVDYKVSSGLVTHVRDWPRYAPDALAKVDPEVVVFMIGANDVTIVSSYDGDGDGVPDWEPEYREKVAHMMDLMLENDRVVLWIGSPTMRDGNRDKGAIELNRVMREEAMRRAPDVVYVDAYRIFADEEGDYTDSLEDANGDLVRVRIGDGVHFTPKGAGHLAAAVFALLDARYDIVAQTDPEHAKQYRIVRGSGETSGSGGSSRSPSTTVAPDDDGDQPGPSTTTPPTTAATSNTTTAPTTSPPTTTAPATTTPPPATTTPPDTAAP